MDRTKAIGLLRMAVPVKAMPDDEIGFFIEAVNMAIKALEKAPTISGNTLTIKVPNEDIDKVLRVMLDCAPWCKVFYEVGKDTNVPSKWTPVTEKYPKKKGEYLVTYHPCYWGNVQDAKCVGIDTFRGKTSWAKNKYQRVIAWAEKPEPWEGE